MLTKWAECHRNSAKWGPTPTPETSVGSGSSMLTADWKTKKDILFCWPLWTASRFWTHTTQAKARITTMICCLLRLQITTTRAPSWQLAEPASVDLGLPKGHLGKHELKQALSSKAVHKHLRHLEKMHFKSKLSAVITASPYGFVWTSRSHAMKSAVWALGDGQAVRLTWVASSHRGPPTIYLPSWSERRRLASTGRSWGLHWRCAWVCLNDM